MFPFRADTEEKFTTKRFTPSSSGWLPAFLNCACQHCAATSRRNKKVPYRCTPTTSLKSSKDFFGMRASRVMPATLTTPFTTPVASSACATARCTCASSATFAAAWSGVTFATLAISAATSFRRPASRSMSTICAPCSASAVATARPMPCAAPVTRWVSPSNAPSRSTRAMPGPPAEARMMAAAPGRHKSAGDGAAHAGAAEPAVAARVLVQVLLVVVLREVEGRRLADLGGDRAEAGLAERARVGVARRLGRLALRLAVGVDGRAVLGADVVALAHALRGVVALPEDLQQRVVRDSRRIEHHLHHLGVPGAP